MLKVASHLNEGLQVAEAAQLKYVGTQQLTHSVFAGNLKLAKSANLVLTGQYVSTHIEYRQLDDVAHPACLANFRHPVFAFDFQRGNLFD